MTENERMTDKILPEIAKEIKHKLPEGIGFCLLAYETGEGNNRRMMYISNSDRNDVANAMLEWVEKVRRENYGKHVK